MEGCQNPSMCKKPRIPMKSNEAKHIKIRCAHNDSACLLAQELTGNRHGEFFEVIATFSILF